MAQKNDLFGPFCGGRHSLFQAKFAQVLTGEGPPSTPRWDGGYPMYTFGQKSGTEPENAEGSQFHLHPSWSVGWTLSGEDLGKFGLEKAILGYLRPF